MHSLQERFQVSSKYKKNNSTRYDRPLIFTGNYPLFVLFSTYFEKLKNILMVWISYNSKLPIDDMQAIFSLLLMA